MPLNCIIPHCAKTRDKKSVFRVPSNITRREKWITLIQIEYPKLKIPKIFLVCEKHFKKDDILIKKIIKNCDGKIIFERELIRKKLKDGANPFFTSSLKIEETLCIDEQQMNESDKENSVEVSKSNQDSDDVTLSSNILPPVSSLSELRPTSPIYCEEQAELLIEKQYIFQDLLHNKSQVNLPDITWGLHRSFELRSQILLTQACMSKEKNMIIIKQVFIYEDLQYKVLFLNKEALSGQHILENLDDINLLLEHVHSLTLCQGGPVISEFKDIHPLCAIQDNITNTWRHKKCPVQTSGEEVCKFCVSLYKILQQNADRNKRRTTKKIVLSPSTRKKVIALRAAKRVKVQTVRRQKLKQNIVTDIIEQFQSRIKNLQKQTLEDHLQNLNLPECQRMLINECIFAAKRSNSHGRRYSEGWLLLCLLYKIRSSSGYNFLRNNNILPFPSPTTIYRYLRKIDTRTGFDPQCF